ncbi:MAG: gamma-glutamyltransferase [Rhodospirillales bacterium]|nr:gamma-glutamyltransferase [Rhodospirillales bacterium]
MGAKDKSRQWLRQITVSIALVGALAGLAACSSDLPPLGAIGHAEGDFGGAVSDEPRASLVARDILSAGGTATDAAVALYFALSVTFPSGASLGGGGVCVVHDSRTRKVEVIDFRVGAPSSGGSGASGDSGASGGAGRARDSFGIPGNPRGMFALHARYGHLRWQQLVTPAEDMARFGAPVSRALAFELRRGGGRGGSVFKSKSGVVPKEGDNLQQVELSATLGLIRAKGAGVFYTGLLARKLEAGAASLGASLKIGDLRDYRPVWRKTVTGKFGNHTVHFPPSPVSGGAIAAQMWDSLVENGGYKTSPAAAREQSLVTSTMAALRVVLKRDRRKSNFRVDYGVTSFATIDRAGGAVACSVTANDRFGAGRIIPGTGILAARSPRSAKGGVSLAPMLIINPHSGNSYFAAASSGNAVAPAAMISVALRVLLDKQPVKAAVAAPRFRAAKVNASSARVNLIYCPGGMRDSPKTCSYGIDPGGHGYAATGGN